MGAATSWTNDLARASLEQGKLPSAVAKAAGLQMDTAISSAVNVNPSCCAAGVGALGSR